MSAVGGCGMNMGATAQSTTTAGGATAAGAGGSPIAQALQALTSALTALKAAIASMGGAAGATGGGQALQGAMGAQASSDIAAHSANSAAMQAMSGQDHMSMAMPGGGGATNVSKSSAELLGPSIVSADNLNGSKSNVSNAQGATKTIFARPVPEDPTKAAAVLKRLMDATAKYADPAAAKAAGFDFTKHAIEGDLLHVSKPSNGLNLDDPNMLLYRKAGNGFQLAGVVLGAHGSAPDLGMGQWHVHNGNQDMMKHIWFTPNDLQQAFSEKKPPL